MVSKNLLIIVLIAGLAFFALPGLFKGGSIATNPSAPNGGVCAAPLGSAQTISTQTYDFDKSGTAVAPTTEVVYNADGSIFAGNKSTNPGSSYVYYAAKSGYFGTQKPFVASCTETNPAITSVEKAVDTSISFSVIDSDGLTANTLANNQSISAAGTASVQLRLTPSALYKHLSGEMNKYTVYLNSTYASNWTQSGFNLVGIDGNPCVLSSRVAPAAITGQIVAQYDCTGDFSGKDTSYKAMQLTAKAASNLASGSNIALTAQIVGWDYYQNTITGALSSGPVKDDGSAIQALQTKAIYFN